MKLWICRYQSKICFIIVICLQPTNTPEREPAPATVAMNFQQGQVISTSK